MTYDNFESFEIGGDGPARYDLTLSTCHSFKLRSFKHAERHSFKVASFKLIGQFQSFKVSYFVKESNSARPDSPVPGIGARMECLQADVEKEPTDAETNAEMLEREFLFRVLLH